MNQSGLDGPTEDDVPMMHVGPPTVADPNQVTSKPRQMPSSGAAPGVPGGTGVSDGGQEPLDFDPDALGGPEQAQRAEGNDTSDAGNEDTANQPMETGSFSSKAMRIQSVAMAQDIWDANPGLTMEAVIEMVADVLGERLVREGASIPIVRTPTPGMGGGVGLGDILNGIPKSRVPMTNRDGTPFTDAAGNQLHGSPAQQRELQIKQFVKEKASDALQKWIERRQGPTPGPDLPPPPPPRNPYGTGTQARPSGQPHPGSPVPAPPVVGNPAGNIDRLRGGGPDRPEGTGEPVEPQEPTSTRPDVPHDSDPIPEEGTREGETPLARRLRITREMLTGNGGGGTQKRPGEERDDW